MIENTNKSSITYQASKDYIHRKIAGADVLISIGMNVANFNGYIEMNSSAIAIWDMLKEPCCEDDLVNMLKEKFNISEEVARGDVKDFINELVDNQMISIVKKDA